MKHDCLDGEFFESCSVGGTSKREVTVKKKSEPVVKALRRASEYKPLLFTTTLRNPERLREFLVVLKKFDGNLLTDDLCIEIEGELIRLGLYKPTRHSLQVKEKWLAGEALKDSEVREILRDNPQDHKEAGFNKGWPSRFDTHFKIAKVFGCVFYEVGEQISFSSVGNFCVADETGRWQQVVFLNGLSKYHRNNPFIRVRNENKPLLLLVKVLMRLREINGPQDPGIARHELALLGVWKDNDAESLLAEVLRFRAKNGFSVSDEVLFEHCGVALAGWSKKMDVATITRDLPDDLMRKFRLTGLFVLRGGGRFLSLSDKSLEKTSLLISNHSDLLSFDNEQQYFNYVADIDVELIDLQSKLISKSETSDYAIEKWVLEIGEEEILKNLDLLSRRKPSAHAILRLLDEPLRLEFLATLLLALKIPNVEVRPNYRCDDDGLPLSTAPGGVPDIAVISDQNCVAVEVTLMRNRQQVHLEMIPIERHLGELGGKFRNSSAIFVAPDIHPDATRYAEFALHDKGLKIETRSIRDFAKDLPGLVVLALQ